MTPPRFIGGGRIASSIPRVRAKSLRMEGVRANPTHRMFRTRGRAYVWVVQRNALQNPGPGARHLPRVMRVSGRVHLVIAFNPGVPALFRRLQHLLRTGGAAHLFLSKRGNRPPTVKRVRRATGAVGAHHGQSVRLTLPACEAGGAASNLPRLQRGCSMACDVIVRSSWLSV